MDFNIIFLLIILIGCGAAYLYLQRRRDGSKVGTQNAAQKTAQDFINVEDIGENCLYTIDGMAFSYIKLDGVCMELYTDAELSVTSRTAASDLSKLRFPWKFISVSRPIDINRTLRYYEEIYQSSEGGQRAMLKHEMNELAAMAIKGDTLERQHYIIVWGSRKEEKQVVKNAQEIAKIFNNNRVKAEIMDKRGIVELCNLVNIPAYAQLESIETDDTVLNAIIRQQR